MIQLPPAIASRYRPATEREVHSWSFGQLKAPRHPHATGWEQRRRTLDDQAIFGPLRDFECACGKYQGPKHQNMICDRCGVKVTTPAVRRRRFGHIDLPVPIVHPLGQNAERLSAIPVLPAALIESRGGEGLADLYDELLRSILSQALDGLSGSFNRIIELLLPAVVFTHQWDLQEAQLLACGMALVDHRLQHIGSAHDTCGSCGYPLEGLSVQICPGCGKKLR
jgi:hypothetical protein